MNKSKCFNVVTSLYAYICVYTCLSLTYGTQKSVFIHPYHKYLACYYHGARWYSEQRWSSAGLLPSGGEKNCNRPQKIATQILRYVWGRMFQLNEKRTAERAVRACEPTGQLRHLYHGHRAGWTCSELSQAGWHFKGCCAYTDGTEL